MPSNNISDDLLKSEHELTLLQIDVTANKCLVMLQKQPLK
jgi:hypothetical protein